MNSGLRPILLNVPFIMSTEYLLLTSTLPKKNFIENTRSSYNVLYILMLKAILLCILLKKEYVYKDEALYVENDNIVLSTPNVCKLPL